MNFSTYQQQALITDNFDPDASLEIMSPSFMEKLLGLIGESGEIAEKIKKIIRDQDGLMTDEQRQDMVKELGDVLWYVNALAIRFGSSLEEVAQKNNEKLASRNARGKIHGSGDNR